MKNKIIIVIIVLLVALVIIVRISFNKKLIVFNKELEIYVSSQLVTINQLKVKQTDILLKKDKQLSLLFSTQFNLDSSYLIKDTLFKYLYLKKKVSFRCPSQKYVNCLANKCELDIKNGINLKNINRIKKVLSNTFSGDYNEWFPILESKLVRKEIALAECDLFFKSYYLIVWDEKVWTEFNKFLLSYQNNKKSSLASNRMITNKFQYLCSSTQSNLNADGKRYFNDRISIQKSAILLSDSLEFVFNSVLLGDIKYKLEKLTLDMEKYANVEENALEEQYRNFSLATGAMPYYECYGSYNSCSNWSCSEIVVENGGKDVLVLVKDRNDDVVRHAYINGGHRFAFDIPDGTYIVYFYSGQGWNPRKVIDGTNCKLRGGFISNENITKGTYETLQGQQLTYVLRLQQDGNFSPRSSSMGEAFK